MKKLIIAAFACIMAAVTFAAQCEGKTKAGERCKANAVTGSKFCRAHADQAKPEKLKDDGTCWAVTEAGTRCKHKKDGDSDYCKQHGVNTKAKKPGGQCRALKWDGARCTRDADGEFIYCKQHRNAHAAGKQAAAEKEEAKPAKKAKKQPAKK